MKEFENLESEEWIPNHFPSFSIKDKEIEKALRKEYGEQLDQIFKFLPSIPRSTSILVNSIKSTKEMVIKKLKEESIEAIENSVLENVLEIQSIKSPLQFIQSNLKIVVSNRFSEAILRGIFSLHHFSQNI